MNMGNIFEDYYCVRQKVLDKAMAVATEDNSATSEKESTSEKNEENTNTNATTYSVVAVFESTLRGAGFVKP